MTEEPEDFEEPIDSLTSSMFRQIRCPKMDALTIFIPEGQEPPPEVEKMLDEVGLQRWFPEEKGNLVKCPNVLESYDEKLFTLEKDGWDHEHCDKCGGTIEPEELCWKADKGNSVFLFCNRCYQKLK